MPVRAPTCGATIAAFEENATERGLTIRQLQEQIGGLQRGGVAQYNPVAQRCAWNRNAAITQPHVRRGWLAMAPDRSPSRASHFSRFLTGRGLGQARLRVASQQVVCPQGAPDDALFYIEAGWVKISVTSRAGREAVLAIRGPGNFFGTRSLIAGHWRRGSATTLSECAVVRVTRAAAIRLLRTEPDFAEMLTVYLTLQGQRDQASLADQLIYPSERRLARTLLRLANDGGDRMPAGISMRINQDDLASMIGTTRSRVSHFMNKFRRSGFIEYNRQGYITVHRSLRNIDADLKN